MKFKNFSIETVVSEMLNFGIRAELDEKILDKMPVKSRSVYKWRKLNSFPMDYVIQFNASVHVRGFKSGNGNAHSRIKIQNEFDESFAYLLGAFKDGSLIKSGGKHFVRVYDTSDAAWIMEVKKVINKLFEIDIHIRHQKKINAAYLDISSKPLFYLLKILFGENMHKETPEIIETAPLDLKKAYIRGFFDAEGHVPHKKSTRCQIDFTQKDQKSLEFVSEILGLCGIKCGKISGHRLPIYGKENLSKFHEVFPLLNQEKTNRLKLLFEAPPSG